MKYFPNMNFNTGTEGSPCASPASTCASSEAALSPPYRITSITPLSTTYPRLFEFSGENYEQNPFAALQTRHSPSPYFVNKGNELQHNSWLYDQEQALHKDEISKSLKTFALSTSRKSRRDINQLCSDAPVDAIMEDFASNGRTADEFYSDPLKQLSNSHCLEFSNSSAINQNNGWSKNNLNLSTVSGASNCANNSTYAINPDYFNASYNEMCKHFLMLKLSQQIQQIVPSPVQQVGLAMAAANAAASWNRKNTINKPNRRYLNKSEKLSTVKHCVFCENNKEVEAVVKSHTVRDAFGRVLCPKLRTYVCPICKASGDMAHTIKYCPQKPIVTMDDTNRAELIPRFKNSTRKHVTKT